MNDSIHTPKQLVVIAQTLTQDYHESLTHQYIYIYWLLWVFLAVCRLSLVAVNVVMHELLIVVASLVAERGL